MLARLSIITAIIAIPLSANAEEFVVRDARGRTVERIIPGNVPGQLIQRDPMGRQTGTIEDTVGENKVLRDSSGRRIGAIERGANDDWVVRDTHGHRTETLRSEPIGGGYIRRDPSGKSIGTITPR